MKRKLFAVVLVAGAMLGSEADEVVRWHDSAQKVTWGYVVTNGEATISTPGTGLAATAKANGTVTLAGKIGSTSVSGMATLEVSGTGTATARFFSGKFVTEVVYALEGGEVVSASGRVWKK